MEEIIKQLETHIQRSFQSGNKYDFIDPAYELCEQLEALDLPAAALEPLFRLIERSPDIDFGGPGPLGAFLESFYDAAYEENLLSSLRRKPTIYTLFLLDRLVRDDNNPRQAAHLETLLALASDASQPASFRQEAMECVKSAAEHLHPWDERLATGIAAAKKLVTEEIRQQEARQRQVPPAPGGSIIHNGISFKMIDRKAAAVLMPVIRDLPGSGQLYDVWADPSPGNACFLLMESDAQTVDFELLAQIPGIEDLTVLGYIFIRSLQIENRLISTSGVPLIVFGDFSCPQARLRSGHQYFGGNVSADLIWASDARLYFDGSVSAKVILADTTPVFIREMAAATKTVSISGMNFYIRNGRLGEWLQTPASHDPGEVFLPEFIVQDEYGNDILADAPAMACIQQNKSILQ